MFPKKFNMRKLLSFFFLYLTFYSCFASSHSSHPPRSPQSQSSQSSQSTSQNTDVLTYEEPIQGLQFYVSYVDSKNIYLMLLNEDPQKKGCALPEVHIRVISPEGHVTYVDIDNYNFPAETLCPIKIDFSPLDPYLLIIYESLSNGLVIKRGLIVDQTNNIINDVILGNFRGTTTYSTFETAFIYIEDPNEHGIAAWRRYNFPDDNNKALMESSGNLTLPDQSTHMLVDSTTFRLTSGGFGTLWAMKYNEATGLDNPSYWKVYASFLGNDADHFTRPRLIYRSTQQLNNIKFHGCVASVYGEGYICIVSLMYGTNTKFYSMKFLSTGETTSLEMIVEPENPLGINILLSSFGGFVVVNEYGNTAAIDGYVVDERGNYFKSWGSFGPEFSQYLFLRYNNTIIGIIQNGQNINLVSKEVPKIINYDNNNEYDNPIIESTIPSIRDIVDPTTDKISIKYNIPVRLSSSNISVFQVNENGPDILRQTFPGNSKFCRFDDKDDNMVHIEIFSSTFSQPNATYYIKIDANFVASPDNDEPLAGVRKNWKFVTSSFKIEEHSESVDGIIKLDKAASQIFRKTNKTEYFDKIFQEFSRTIPIEYERFSTDYRSQQDSKSPDNELLSFKIKKAEDINTQQSSQKIFETLKTLLANKEYTGFSWNDRTSSIEEINLNPNYSGKLKIPGIGIGIFTPIILILYVVARKKNPAANNFSAVFGTATALQDQCLDVLLLLNIRKNIPRLFILGLLSLMGPMFFNIFVAVYTISTETKNSANFSGWVKENSTLSGIITFLSAADLEIFGLLESKLFGMELFDAPFSAESKKIIFWGPIFGIFIEVIPQFGIQLYYFYNTVNYDILPLLSIITSVVMILIKIVSKFYETSAECRSAAANNDDDE